MKKAGLIFLFLIIIVSIFVKSYSLVIPVSYHSKQPILIEIKKGATGNQIATQLYNKGLIRSPRAFKLILSLKKANDDLKAGNYKLNQSDNLFAIINKILSGQVMNFRFTIPEGFTAEEVVARAVNLTDLQVADFRKAMPQVAERFKLESAVAAKLGPNEEMRLLEGYLYPETYFFDKNVSAESMLNFLVNNFMINWQDKLEKKAAETEFSPYELLTIASMIEAEAKQDEEKAIVASVIYNRLAEEMLLQIDATVQYILPERKERLLYEDLEVDSKYNTYQQVGLPPGPISNPGAKAIEAALNPADTDYLFYFAKNDGTHVFTKNYEQHLIKQREIKNGK